MTKVEVVPNGGHQNSKKTVSYWDPVFQTADPAMFQKASWDFVRNGGPRLAIFDAAELKSPVKIERIHFENCDFIGIFPEYSKFSNCIFEKCDFSNSTFTMAKFNSCRFKRSSLSTATFQDSEFRDCTWEEIGLSGNTTKLDGTIITNPTKFIEAAYTAENPNEQNGQTSTKRYQRARLEITKSEIARAIYQNHTRKGSDKDYYECVQLTTIQSIKEEISHRTIENISPNIKIPKLLFNKVLNSINTIDMQIIILVLNINAWGRSITRPLFFGLIIISLYTAAYCYFLRIALLDSIIMSLDISLVAGYTKHSSTLDGTLKQILAVSNLVVGLIWYAVIIPTVINRISKVR
ncbi:hypothetical protein EYW49_20885 [Siculibacillus lacustris]|uniref:Pentapeptide repeat-containing protein n=1 Tax=Siculibacillus lacustris TaxID=1549641 RepID=A0A4V6MYY6_9HYPH|nr:pentapeptide repeat-containing protein [Siculibacillus lacustris]TBW33073.1 hypothetical protein EYW49_20885 [Siculibacillus lacustris]